MDCRVADSAVFFSGALRPPHHHALNAEIFLGDPPMVSMVAGSVEVNIFSL